MKAVQQTIRILVIILLANHARCQDVFSDRDVQHYHQIGANEGQIESNYNAQRDPNQSNQLGVQYHMIDDTNDYNRADRARSRKVYRIKNPFSNQLEDIDQKDGNADSQDSGTAASNQYASMQYSLPPEEFLQQMRENQYHQQLQQQTTPAPNLGYTATPLPQYQYPTIPSGNYDNTNQQSNQIPQIEIKSRQYMTGSGYQFNPQNTFLFDSVQSTPSPVTTYVSTALPNSQYVSSSNSYVSSSSPVFLSSPSNVQYVSSPLSNIQTGTVDYSSRLTTTVGGNSFSYDSNDQNQKLQIDHYDNSANGIRYPVNAPQQHQNEYGSSTLSPTSVSYSDSKDGWQNNLSPDVNSLSKSLQEISLTQSQNYPHNHQEARSDTTLDTNSETHRMGAVAAANNLYLNFAQPDYQIHSNGKSRTRDTEQQTTQPEYYSNGDYGWKLTDKKIQHNNDGYSSASSGNHQRYQPGPQNSGQAMSQMTFQMDTSRPSNYDQVSKSATDSIEAQEFAKAAANAHAYMKQQQAYYGNNYSNNYNTNQGTPYNSNSFYGTVEKQRTKYTDVSTPGPYLYSSQPDLITASPYFYNTKENSIDNKPKQPFDHAKALKTIVPIDVSNVVSNSDSQLKGVGLDGNRFAIQNYGKEQFNQNQLQQQYRPLSDIYYKDKNAYYGINIKTRPEELQTDNSKQIDTNTPYYAKPQQYPESIYNQGIYAAGSRVSYNTQNSQENIQSPVNVQQGLQRAHLQMPTDMNSMLKINDVPYQITQNFSPESFRFQNNDFDRGRLPTQIPMRINQDVASHQLDVTSNILNKLLFNKQAGIPFNRPDFETQATGGLSTINGYKVANPFNVDLKLVAEILKGKNPEFSSIVALRDQFNKQTPQNQDLAQLQYILKSENFGNLSPINEGLSALSNPFIEVYNNGRYPYQGMKYSRSQEEEEEAIVPIADASSNHPIGAVTDQDEPTHERETNTGSDATAQGEESIAINFEDESAKKPYITGHRMTRDRHRHPNSLISGRPSYQRKYPKSEVEEPYPLLKPPPPHSVRGRGNHIKPEKQGRRRRVKPRTYKVFKTEPLFEAESENENSENSVPIVLRPPPPVVESKSDNVESIEENV